MIQIAGSKSDYFEALLLNAIFGAGAMPVPGTWYIALSTAAYSDAATGSAMSEVTGTGYARAAVTNNATNFPAATGTNPATKTTGAPITFATAGGAWTGPVLSFYIVDALTGGNVWYGGDLTVSKTIASGDTASFASGALVVTED